jgi:hypothetical protein
MKDQFNKLADRLKGNVTEVEKMIENTHLPPYGGAPDASILTNLLKECEDTEFWQNFKKAAPVIFCTAIEQDTNLKQMRDMSFIEELLKVKTIMKMM